MNQVEIRKLQRKSKKSIEKLKAKMSELSLKIDVFFEEKKKLLRSLRAKERMQQIKESGDAYLDQVVVTVTGLSKKLSK